MAEWNVYYNSFNDKAIKPYNILNDHFVKSLRDIAMECKTREEFEERLERECVYRYWSKYEWEVVISEFSSREDKAETKVDVYGQLRMNWPAFVRAAEEAVTASSRSKKLDYLRG